MTDNAQFPNPFTSGTSADARSVPPQQTPPTGAYGAPPGTQPGFTPGQPAGYAPAAQCPPQYRPAPVPAAHAPQWLPLPHCTFAEAVKRFFIGYVRFDSRSSRLEFWYSYLFVMMVSATLAFTTITTLPAIATLWSAATAIPMLAVGARRLHDSGRSAVPLAVNTVLTMVSAGASAVSGVLFMAVAFTLTKGPEHSPFDELTLYLLMGIFAVSVITAIAMFIWYVWMMSRPSDPSATRWDR